MAARATASTGGATGRPATALLAADLAAAEPNTSARTGSTSVWALAWPAPGPWAPAAAAWAWAGRSCGSPFVSWRAALRGAAVVPL